MINIYVLNLYNNKLKNIMTEIRTQIFRAKDTNVLSIWTIMILY
jgi:hypothetical protein